MAAEHDNSPITHHDVQLLEQVFGEATRRCIEQVKDTKQFEKQLQQNFSNYDGPLQPFAKVILAYQKKLVDLAVAHCVQASAVHKFLHDANPQELSPELFASKIENLDARHQEILRVAISEGLPPKLGYE